MCKALQLPCLEIASENSEGGLLRKRSAQASQLFNKPFRTTEQQPSHTPSKAATESDNSLRAPMDEKSAARLLNQLQSQREFTQSHLPLTNPAHQTSASTGFPSTSENKQGPPSLDESRITGDDFMGDDGTCLRTAGPVQRIARNEVVNNCSNMSPEAFLIRSQNHCADPQNFSQIGNDQAPVDSRNEDTIRWQAQVVQNDPGVKTAVSKTSEALYNENSPDTPSHPEQSIFLSDQAERVLQGSIDRDMDLFEGWNINPDMGDKEGLNIDPDMDV